MRRRRKKNNKNVWLMVLLVGLIIVVAGAVIYIGYDKKNNKTLKENSTVNEKKSNESTTTNDTTTTESTTVNEETTTKESSKEKEYNFTNQNGDDVTVEANKMVEATGFSGASNYKFYLRGTTLYFDNISDSTAEEVIAYNVKDLYLENKEVVAELGANGKIVKENNYITYK